MKIVEDIIVFVLFLFVIYLFCGAAFVTPRLLREGPPKEWQDSSESETQ